MVGGGSTSCGCDASVKEQCVQYGKETYSAAELGRGMSAMFAGSWGISQGESMSSPLLSITSGEGEGRVM
jgi:hypothetical protein